MTTTPKTHVRVLILLGSPRKNGNSSGLAQAIQKGAATAGAAVENVYLNGLHIRPCQACYTCQKPDAKGCRIEDDMQTLYPKLIQADAWVIASPVYWFTVSAQTKLFMDRCFALISDHRPSLMAGKKIGVAMSYGDVDCFSSGCVNALRTFQDAYRYVGADIVGMVHGSAENPGDIKADAELMQAAEQLGRELVQAAV